MSTRENYKIFDIPDYNVLRKYLLFLGQDPHQPDWTRNIIVFLMVFSILSMIIPTYIEIYVQLSNMNVDPVIECLPHVIAAMTAIVKLMNVHLNRENFKIMYKLVAEEWENLKQHNELHVLSDITTQGTKLARVYRTTLLFFMLLFFVVPLIFPVMDIVLPLNETRPRQQGLRLNYLFFDQENYFFYVYIHSFWSVFISVLSIVTVDSLYMTIIHHTSGMFAVCSYQMEKATECKSLPINSDPENYMNELFRRCVETHNNAIQFHNILSSSSQNSYLLQVGLNMMGISITAVQTVLTLDRPEVCIKAALLLGAKQFHLFILSLPGQVLLDHCNALTNDIYCSTWYKVPVKFQRIVYTMQIRSLTPCELTAGGLYTMNMENFATTFKTCMSYITMLMSLRE